MIVVLTGPNDYMRNFALKQLKADFLSTNDEFSLEVIDASETDMGRVIDSVASVPFLSDRRMVVLTSISVAKSLADDIDKIINATSDTTDLIIDEPKFDKRLSLYKTLKRKAEFREFNEFDERQLANWLVAEAKQRQATISLADARYLISRVGSNQLMLDSELEKLINYNPSITKESINLLVYPTPSSSIFDLLEAVFTGNKRRAIELYEDQRRQLVEPQEIMGMIIWQLHILAVVKFNSSADIASKSKINPYVVQKTSRITSRLSESQVKRLVKSATELDYRLKSSAIDADDAVQHFLLTI